MPLDFSRSLRMFEKTKRVIPSCTQTFSKGWTQYPFGVSPIFLERGEGCFVWDVDGNKFIDWPMALGPVILGHNYPPVSKWIRA
jgi:glutamate-1-semialdehyde aminotransferase